jgi:hypothetical protein
MLSNNRRQAYTEIVNFIELLDEYNRNKIPKKLMEFFKVEKDNNYTKVIDPNVPIKEQNLKKETLALIAMLNLQYWCEDEKEKQRLKKIYANNEIKYQEELRDKYNPDDLFKTKQKTIETNHSQQTAMIEYKELSIFQRIKEFIKNIFKATKK